MSLYACVECGRISRSRRCSAHELPPRARGRPYRRVRAMILERDHMICQSCGAKLTTKTAEIAHRMDRAEGGTEHPSNLYASCSTCNSRANIRRKTFSLP